MRGGNIFGHNFVSNVVIVNLNMLHMLIKSGIASDEDSGLIITIHGHWRERRDAKIFEKRSKPYHLPRNLSRSLIPGLCARA